MRQRGRCKRCYKRRSLEATMRVCHRCYESLRLLSVDLHILSKRESMWAT